jgi:hypothetical protein
MLSARTSDSGACAPVAESTFEHRATYDEDELRERAVVRLKKRAQFRSHVITYVLVNFWHVVIWAVIWATTGLRLLAGLPGRYWSVFLALNWWDIYRRKHKPPKAEGPTAPSGFHSICPGA